MTLTIIHGHKGARVESKNVAERLHQLSHIVLGLSECNLVYCRNWLVVWDPMFF